MHLILIQPLKWRTFIQRHHLIGRTGKIGPRNGHLRLGSRFLSPVQKRNCKRMGYEKHERFLFLIIGTGGTLPVPLLPLMICQPSWSWCGTSDASWEELMLKLRPKQELVLKLKARARVVVELTSSMTQLCTRISLNPWIMHKSPFQAESKHDNSSQPRCCTEYSVQVDPFAITPIN